MMAPILVVCLTVALQGDPSAVGGSEEETAAALATAAVKSAPTPDERAVRQLGRTTVDVVAAEAILEIENLDPLTLEIKRTALLLELREVEAKGTPASPTKLSPKIGLELLAKLEATANAATPESPIAILAAEQEAEAAKAQLEAERAGRAEQVALADAKEARSFEEEEILQIIAKVESTRELVAQAHAQLLDAAARDLEDLEEDRVRANALDLEAKAKDTSEARLWALLPSVIEEQDAELSAVLVAIAERAKVASRTAPVGAEGLTAEQVNQSTTLAAESTAIAKRVVQLKASLAALEEAQESLGRDRKERWLDVATAHFEVAEQLHHARLAAISRLRATKRAELVGFTPAGLSNLTVVGKFVWVDLRLHHQRRIHDLTHLPQTLSEPFVLGPIAWNLSTALVVLLLVAWGWRRAETVRAFLLNAVKRRAASPTSLRLTETVFLLFDAIIAPAVVIALAIWLDRHLIPVVPDPERTVLVEVAFWWAAYFALARLTHLIIVRFARGRFAMTARQKLKVLKSVRFTLRYVVIAIYVLRMLRGLLGGGPAMAVAQLLAGLGLLVVALIMVRRWRDEIHGYAEQGAETSLLRRILTATKGRWFALGVEALAAIALTLSAIISLLRSFLMGFDQVRKAGAFFFRLRVEREAQRKGKTKFDLESVPMSVREVFDEERNDEKLVIDHLAELDTAVTQICTDGDERLGIIVHAPYGVGRATWLAKLRQRLQDRGQRVVTYRPASRILGAGKLASRLGRCLDEHPAVDPPDEVSVSAIVDVLNACEEPLVVIVDGLEWLYLRTVNGYRAIDALVDIMHRTHKKVSFVLSAPSASFRHLDRVRAISSEVSRVLEIPRFTESQVRELILRRQRSSGVSVSFKDLLVQEMDGMREAAQVVENEEGYMRLLWTFSEGVPRVAMHFWLRSLVPDPDREGQLAVQLYDAPSADDLEAIPERDRFLLQTIVLHRALTVDQVAASCDVRRSQARAHIHRGLEMGLYTEFQGTPAAKRAGSTLTGAYCVDVHFWEAAVRFLRRKKLL